jgi:hypothetical protein
MNSSAPRLSKARTLRFGALVGVWFIEMMLSRRAFPLLQS